MLCHAGSLACYDGLGFRQRKKIWITLGHARWRRAGGGLGISIGTLWAGCSTDGRPCLVKFLALCAERQTGCRGVFRQAPRCLAGVMDLCDCCYAASDRYADLPRCWCRVQRVLACWGIGLCLHPTSDAVVVAWHILSLRRVVRTTLWCDTVLFLGNRHGPRERHNQRQRQDRPRREGACQAG